MAIAVQVLRTLNENKERPSSGIDEDAGKVIPGLIAIQDQILGNKLPDEYNYRSIPAPWFQMDVLALITVLVDRSGWSAGLYEDITAAVYRTMEQPSASKECAGQAIIFQCIVLIAAMNRLESDVQRSSRNVDMN